VDVKELHEKYGQSVWLDDMRRHRLQSGDFSRMVQNDGIRGATSNPSIFEKAIAGSTDYGPALERYEKRKDATASAIYEHLAIQDIQQAADLLRPVYEQSERRDGYVSMEVSPYLAHDTQATLDEAEYNYNRTKRLVESGSEADADLIGARARMLEAKAHLESLTATRAAVAGRVSASEAAVADARAAVNTAEAALEVAKVQLAEAQVLCPFDGLVVQRNLQPGEWAAPGTPVVTVEDLSQLWVRLDIEETQLDNLQIGHTADVRVLAEPTKVYRGHVIDIGAEGDFAVNRDVKRGRPDIRTFLVRVAIDEPARSLRPGMTAEVSMASLSASSVKIENRAER